jgi:hypothetical protein
VVSLKFSRDRRGYEHFSLVQLSNRSKARPRVLYWFRTPPNIKVGRSPFDPEVRRALEVQNPDIAFDWEAIVRTPIPPPMEPERWRERRRVERVLRAAESEEADSMIADASEPSSQAEVFPEVPQAVDEPEDATAPRAVDEVSATADPLGMSNPSSAAAPANAEGGTPRQGRRRRRRRGRRKPTEASKAQEPAIQDSGEPGDGEV